MLFLVGAVVGTVAFWVAALSRRASAADMGWMSEQWLAEYRSGNPD